MWTDQINIPQNTELEQLVFHHKSGTFFANVVLLHTGVTKHLAYKSEILCFHFIYDQCVGKESGFSWI